MAASFSGKLLKFTTLNFLVLGSSVLNPGGLWGAALSFVLDESEPCVTREKATIILVHLVIDAAAASNDERGDSLRLLLVESGLFEKLAATISNFRHFSRPFEVPREEIRRPLTTPSLLACTCRLTHVLLNFCQPDAKAEFGRLDVVGRLKHAVGELAKLTSANPDHAQLPWDEENQLSIPTAATEVFLLLRRFFQVSPDELSKVTNEDVTNLAKVFNQLASQESKLPDHACLSSALALWTDLFNGDPSRTEHFLRLASQIRAALFPFVLRGLKGEKGNDANVACTAFLQAFVESLKRVACSGQQSSGDFEDGVERLFDCWDPPVEQTKKRFSGDEEDEGRLGYQLCGALVKHHAWRGEKMNHAVVLTLCGLFLVSGSAQVSEPRRVMRVVMDEYAAKVINTSSFYCIDY
jgi:hypothetical protein